MLNFVTRPWLARAPVLLTAYLVWVNGRRRARRVLSAAFALSIAWMAAASTSVHANRAAAISTLAWLHRHDVFCATICAIAAAVLVSRRRMLNQIAASRSWTAALPVGRATVKWQALVIDTVPALILAGILAAIFGSLTVIALAAGIPTPIIAWGAMTGGVMLGAGSSYLLPTGGHEEIYEGSRYVPHHRRRKTPVPTGSLAALGSWPVRQMFASARPKTIARALAPILVLVPVGSTAAGVMLAVGSLCAMGSLVLLVAAAISVSAKASRWLEPLPLASGRVARRTLIPALALMFCITSIESWLIWVIGSPLDRCIGIGVITLLASMLIAIAGSLRGILASKKVNHDRL
jgi:hypothetical protein